jgi:hypothetical protein
MSKTSLKSLSFIFVVAVLALGSFAYAADNLSVDTAVICEKVEDREPVSAGTSFPASIERLYCFTKVLGAQTPTEVTHVWYFGDTERARVNLSVRTASWRTYSSKAIQPHEVGAWRVEVLGPTGEILKTVRFEVVQ